MSSKKIPKTFSVNSTEKKIIVLNCKRLESHFDFWPILDGLDFSWTCANGEGEGKKSH